MREYMGTVTVLLVPYVAVFGTTYLDRNVDRIMSDVGRGCLLYKTLKDSENGLDASCRICT